MKGIEETGTIKDQPDKMRSRLKVNCVWANVFMF